jgi:hypothetical protein
MRLRQIAEIEPSIGAGAASSTLRSRRLVLTCCCVLHRREVLRLRPRRAQTARKKKARDSAPFLRQSKQNDGAIRNESRSLTLAWDAPGFGMTT